MLTVLSRAKVNVYLRVLGKRPDGYHELETVMHEIDLADEITFEPDEGLSMTCGHPDVPCDETNLIMRAARLVRAESGFGGGARIALTKRIPVGGGLGGGSSNCAAALKALDRLWRLGMAREDLMRLGAMLGSDVCFFLEGGACLCRGRGEQVQRVPAARGIRYTLVAPDFGCATAAVYRGYRPDTAPAPAVSEVLRALETGDVELLDRLAYNDLKATVYRLYPELAELAGQAGRLAGKQVHLSGSGSTLFMTGGDPAAGSALRERLLAAGHCRDVLLTEGLAS